MVALLGLATESTLWTDACNGLALPGLQAALGQPPCLPPGEPLCTLLGPSWLPVLAAALSPVLAQDACWHSDRAAAGSGLGELILAWLSLVLHLMLQATDNPTTVPHAPAPPNSLAEAWSRTLY